MLWHLLDDDLFAIPPLLRKLCYSRHSPTKFFHNFELMAPQSTLH